VASAQGGELMGKKLIYLEAGCGALRAVPNEIIEKVTQAAEISIVLGGGIRTKEGGWKCLSIVSNCGWNWNYF
jgi:heptaprenylglyceryl phosphate synthase